ncbi:Uncharacterised protein [Candidatus Burarchaeum australiense]|nr:Uncharacterised protein [Candidatus Burarchaeum australiense]
MLSKKGQTTIEYLLLISVVVLLFAGVLMTVNSLKSEAEKPVNISGKEETPVGAIGSQLENLRQVGSEPNGPSLHLTVTTNPELGAVHCVLETITVTVKNEDGPVAEATVKLNSETTTVDSRNTAADGTVTFTPQIAGLYTVSAEKHDNEPGSGQFTVTTC